MPQQLWQGKEKGQGEPLLWGLQGEGGWLRTSPAPRPLAGGLACAMPKQAWCLCQPSFPPPPSWARLPSPNARLQETAIAACPSQKLPGWPQAHAAGLAPCWEGQPSLCPGGTAGLPLPDVWQLQHRGRFRNLSPGTPPNPPVPVIRAHRAWASPWCLPGWPALHWRKRSPRSGSPPRDRVARKAPEAAKGPRICAQS